MQALRALIVFKLQVQQRSADVSEQKHLLGKGLKMAYTANGRLWLGISVAAALKQRWLCSPGRHLTMSGDLFWLAQQGCRCCEQAEAGAAGTLRAQGKPLPSPGAGLSGPKSQQSQRRKLVPRFLALHKTS